MLLLQATYNFTLVFSDSPAVAGSLVLKSPSSRVGDWAYVVVKAWDILGRNVYSSNQIQLTAQRKLHPKNPTPLHPTP